MGRYHYDKTRQNLERNLGQLVAKGWQGWETRESLDELGTPKRILRVCADAGIEIVAVSGPNASDTCDTPTHEICKPASGESVAADCGVAPSLSHRCVVRYTVLLRQVSVSRVHG